MSDRVISIVFFVAIIALTLGITAWASRRNVDTSHHYVAGGEIKGWQNGLAISGDYLSAASRRARSTIVSHLFARLTYRCIRIQVIANCAKA